MFNTSIITVNFRQEAVTIELLKSISQYCSGKNVEVIIVDNGTEQNQEHIFKPHFENIKYIQSIENLGFAGGNNLGIKQAHGDYLFLLNNDTELPADCIETLCAEFEQNENIGLLSPLLLYFDRKDTVQYAGFTPVNHLTGRNSTIGELDQNKGQYANKSYQTGYCHGAAVMCRKEDVLMAGLMDENYFLYYEELDWCEKFKRIGKQVWFTGKTHVYHKESISVGIDSPLKIYFHTRNRMLFMRKNTGLINTILFSIYYTLISCPKAVLKFIFKRQLSLAKQVIRGLLWNYTHDKNSKNLGFKLKR
ncbi:glycosyltransferase family 2 protein [Pedobacter sp. R20-19]|uniref:glycosyltransferase family 2 protein n=1 Tax=Pedobacter sp. R20-19 TaxID=1270196 RepID=UPI0004932AC7|nr:glycosyltransferase family 2 protein [Pedobacter sp. R20-19]